MAPTFSDSDLSGGSSGDGDVADLKVLLPMVPLVCVYNTMSRQNSDSVHTVRLRSRTSQ